MGNPLANLGDYGIVTEAMKAAGGTLEALYKSVGDTAVSKAAPKIFRKGGLVGSLVTLGVIGTSYLGYRGYSFMKERKKLIENEPNLKKEFIEILEAESPMVNDEPTDESSDDLVGESTNDPTNDDEIHNLGEE